MAKIIRRETRKRGFFGKVFKWTFVLFNALMLWWLVAGLMKAIPQAEMAATAAQRAGGHIGTFIGVTLISMIWLAGAVVLGLFTMLTRGSKIIIEETVEG